MMLAVDLVLGVSPVCAWVWTDACPALNLYLDDPGSFLEFGEGPGIPAPTLIPTSCETRAGPLSLHASPFTPHSHLPLLLLLHQVS